MILRFVFRDIISRIPLALPLGLMNVSMFIQEFSLLGTKSTNDKNLREILVREGHGSDI